MEVCRVEAGLVFHDYRYYDVVERQFLDSIVFLDGGQHAGGVYNIWFMRVLNFFSCDDLFWMVSSKCCFVVLEDLQLVFRPGNNDIIVDQFQREG